MTAVQTDRQDKQTARRTNRKTDKQTDRQDRQTDRQTDKQTDTHTYCTVLPCFFQMVHCGCDEETALECGSFSCR